MYIPARGRDGSDVPAAIDGNANHIGEVGDNLTLRVACAGRRLLIHAIRRGDINVCRPVERHPGGLTQAAGDRGSRIHTRRQSLFIDGAGPAFRNVNAPAPVNRYAQRVDQAIGDRCSGSREKRCLCT